MDAYRAQLESFDPDIAHTIAGEESEVSVGAIQCREFRRLQPVAE